MSRKKKISLAVLAAAVLLALLAALFASLNRSGKTDPKPESKQLEEEEHTLIKNATTEVLDPDGGHKGSFEMTEGMVSYSHGFILEPFRYPGWSAKAIALEDGTESDMIQEKDKLYVSEDTKKEVYFAADTSAHTAEDCDLAYVFEAPSKVKMDLVLTGKVTEEGGDGIVVCAYRNDTEHCVINGTIITSGKALEAKEVILEAGDKLYFRYNKNKTTKGDGGNFYAKLTVTELEPEGEATQGEAFKISAAGSDSKVTMPTVGTKTYSHGSIKYPDAYPFWSAVSISHSSKKEKALVKDGDKLYIAGAGKRAYFGADSSANPSDSYDMAYVYTMPCRAKVEIAMTAQVRETGGDGVMGYVYVNQPENLLIQPALYEPGAGSSSEKADNVVLEKGDKVYICYNMNQSAEGDEGNFYGRITYLEMDPAGDGSGPEEEPRVEAGTVTYSHGSIKNPDVYPYWSGVSIAWDSGAETAMIKSGGRLYVAGDAKKDAYFNSDSAACPSDSCDMAYVYTMPCRAKIDIALTAKVSAAGGDGIVGYVYVNRPENLLIKPAVFEGDKGSRSEKANQVILEKGDKIYFRYNKNQTVDSDVGNFYGKITYVEINPQDGGNGEEPAPDQPQEPEVKVEAGTDSYSHGSIKSPGAYPYWETRSIDLSTGAESTMVAGSGANTRYVEQDGSAYVNGEGMAQSSAGHDLLYVYTMPCRAKVDMVLTAGVSGGDSDGVVVYSYRNDTDHCIINYKKVTGSGKNHTSQKDVILEKGDKIYFRLNKNKTTTGDGGYFYAKIHYVEIDPVGAAFEGEPYKEGSQAGEDKPGQEQPQGGVTVGTTTYGNDWILYPQTHPDWKAVAISLADGGEQELVKDQDRMYVAEDSGRGAYFASDSRAQASATHDLAYVYTMPCKAKVDLELTTLVSGDSPDGIAVSCYVNETSNSMIGEIITGRDSLKVLQAKDVVLEKGAKLYFRLNKNGTEEKDAGFFQAKITYVDLNPQEEPQAPITWQEMSQGGDKGKGVYYSHGSISAPKVYPYWETRSVAHGTGEERAMVNGTAANTRYVADDTNAYLNNSGKGMTSDTNDLLYVYTMPCKAKINVTMTASVGSGSDGVVTYCYVNDTSRCIVNRTLVTSTERQAMGGKGITLEKGDKIYFRLNKNKTTTGDNGFFYARIDFLKEAPGEDTFVGEPLEEVTWQEMSKGGSGGNGIYYSHGSINAPKVYPYWETCSISHGTGEEKAMVNGAAANTRYVADDANAYLNKDGKGMTSDANDLLYVYTMPCKAKINVAMTASVGSGSDGVITYCYVNDTSRCIVNRTLVTSTGKQVMEGKGITLEKGDKIYFRLNKNKTTTGDDGFFYVRIDFLKEAPGDNIFAGEPYEETTWQEMAAKGSSFSHGWITEPVKYPYWETVAIALATGEERSMVKDGKAMYIQGDAAKSAHLGPATAAGTSEDYDLAYVYTMPCRGKINVELNAKAGGGGDGVIAGCYVNDPSQVVIEDFTANTTQINKKANGIVLNRGDRIYFRLNKNGTSAGDEGGVFYGKLTFVKEAPGTPTFAEASPGVRYQMKALLKKFFVKSE